MSEGPHVIQYKCAMIDDLLKLGYGLAAITRGKIRPAAQVDRLLTIPQFIEACALNVGPMALLHEIARRTLQAGPNRWTYRLPQRGTHLRFPDCRDTMRSLVPSRPCRSS